MIDCNREFPERILECTDEEKKLYFKNYIVMHKNLKEALRKTFSSLTTMEDESLIFVCGPTGVGKKEFTNAIYEKLTSYAEQKMRGSPGCIPVATVEAQAPGKRGFDFKNLWINTLNNLREPMINDKISFVNEKSYDALGNLISIANRQRANYQDVVQSVLKHREVLALIINEAHHMLRSSGKKANDPLDILKSLVNGSQTPVVMVGTYELLNLMGLCSSFTDQIIQRTKIIHFPCYHLNSKDEILEFGNSAKNLFRNMPLEQTAEKLIDKDWQYFYKNTLGCIGLLKKWLMRAYSLALEENANTLKIDHLEETKMSGQRCLTLLQTIQDGEKSLREIQSEGDIDIKLGFNKKEDTSQKEKPKVTSKDGLKPFERKPKRDPVNVS